MAEEKLSFQAEVSKLLDIVVHSLYSNKEIFLRELISNASDACDKLRYSALTQPELLSGAADFRITLTPDKTARTLTITDNGIGMNKTDLVENLGTIARSGTANFLSQLSGDAKKDVSLIGQFGVGFYSAFMVADKVEVITRKAGETEGWRWTSDGLGEFTIAEDPTAERGAKIILSLRAGEDDFLDGYRLRRIVKTYSDHIALPVVLIEDGKEETANSASALWTRSKSDITAEQYKEFYHHVAHAFDEPWTTLHYKAEGAIEYTALLFIPGQKPADIFNPDRKQHVKLYVNRIFITDDCEALLPSYLRFVRGVVDSQDLPLNISREMLQHNPVLAKIRSGLVKRLLAELKSKAEATDGDYQAFWNTFGAVLKEGLYEDFERRGDIMELCRFTTTASDEPISLATYLSRMKEGQEAIYTISGDEIEVLKRSPQIEGFLAKGVEVLLLTDPIDEFWPNVIGTYQDKPFRSVTQGTADLSAIKGTDKDDEKRPEPAASDAMAALIAAFKLALGEQVKDVRSSDRLIDSPVCLVADDGDVGMHLERLMRQHQQPGERAPRILEINPRHPLIRRLASEATADGAADRLKDTACLLFDQARIVEGEVLPDPASFARRLSAVLEKIA
ncbi:molecular chaperone HtpG [Telmatospirillum sp.]|uniref:molecular chaperone HtpG n=1 Tax=Telmatospirillum sp. TaxID=2079197 RepID=UPI002841168C|nr:molecular chaperone HtpG [Telmatospirillum sp.]MDR3440242.1 molecular chaperone HtpG [Telmatospirillum sp.]